MNPNLKDLIYFLRRMIFDNYAYLKDDAGKFIIHRFEGDAFPSAYKCFLVHSLYGSFDTGDGTLLPERFVVKVTDEQECKLLFTLKRHGFSVPRMLYMIPGAVSEHSSDVLMFQEYIEGTEIWKTNDINVWKMLAKNYSIIQIIFWDKVQITETEPFKQRLHNAQNACAYDTRLTEAVIKAKKRVETLPKVFNHGDLFATNAIFTSNDVYIIDWKDAGLCYYVQDICRLTSTLNQKTNKLFCPHPDDVVNEYYECIQNLIGKSKEDFLQDIYAGQFIELAAYYEPENLIEQNRAYEDRMFSRAHKMRLLKLADKMEW